MRGTVLFPSVTALSLGLLGIFALGLASALNVLLAAGGLGFSWASRTERLSPPDRRGVPSPWPGIGRLLLTLGVAGLLGLGTKNPVAAVVALPVLWGSVRLASEWGKSRAVALGARGAREMVSLIADTMAVQPNIYEAVQSARVAFPEPWQSEVETALGLLRATPGATLAGQFSAMAERTRSREVAVLAKILKVAEEKGEVREQLSRLDLLFQRHQALNDRHRVRVAGHTLLIGLSLLAMPIVFLGLYFWAKPWWVIDTSTPAGKVAVVVATLGETALFYLPRAWPPERE